MDITTLLPKRTFAVRSINGSSKFYHLEMLWLEDVYENIVRDIIRNCPNIKDLDLRSFSGLKTLFKIVNFS